MKMPLTLSATRTCYPLDWSFTFQCLFYTLLSHEHHGEYISVISMRPPRGVPNHAITQIFFHFHAFTQSIKNWDFHAKTLKMGEKHAFHQITQVFHWFHEITHIFRRFHASRTQVDSRNHAEIKSFSRNHAEKKANHAITQPYGGGGLHKDNLK